MDRFSLKIGAVFFITILCLESILFFYLHTSVVHSRIDEELNALLTRGNNHRDILETSYLAETIHHITFMESKTDTHVVITDSDKNIISSSKEPDEFMNQTIQHIPGSIPYKGIILEDNWKSKTYISSVSPLQSNGYVFMFKDTSKVQGLISRLNEHFWLAGSLLIFFMIIIIIFLSKFITRPLVEMNVATKRISKGDYSVSLPKLGKDELGELGESIKILANDLNHIKKQRNEFLASISHELRTPLTYIKGYADIARKEKTSNEDKSKYLNIIYEESSKLSVLIKDLFDLVKLDENSFSIDKKEIELKSFLEKIYHKISPSFLESEINLQLECPDTISVEVDPIRFEQVILNLLDNARKYSEKGTSTKVEVIKLQGNVHIFIKDEGKGIPSEDLPWVFDRFYRVDKSRSKALGGTGLGLAIVKELVEAHHGTISVTSNENGTVFEIIL